MQELPEHQRGDFVSSMVYEANARVRDPVYGCVGAISSLQQQVEVLKAQLAVAQAEVVRMRVRHFAWTLADSPSTPSQQAKSFFSMDVADHLDQYPSFWA